VKFQQIDLTRQLMRVTILGNALFIIALGFFFLNNSIVTSAQEPVTPPPPVSYAKNVSNVLPTQQYENELGWNVDITDFDALNTGDYYDYRIPDNFVIDPKDDTNGAWQPIEDNGVHMGWWYIDATQNFARYIYKAPDDDDSAQLVGLYFPKKLKIIPVTIEVPFRPVDPSGNVIPDISIPSLVGEPGESLTPAFPDIPGFTTPNPSAILIPSTQPDKPIDVVYTPIGAKKIEVPFRPVDPSGNVIPDISIPNLVGEPGESLTPAFPDIPGFTTPNPSAILIPSTQPDEPIDVVYTPIGTKKDFPSTPVTAKKIAEATGKAPKNKETLSKNTEIQLLANSQPSAQTNQNKKAELPLTGSQETSLYLIGSLLLLITGGFYLFKKRY
jgi:LPXTG-motif cell wall-anchored protein